MRFKNVKRQKLCFALTSFKITTIMKTRRALRQAVGFMLGYLFTNNRHLAEWRLLLFTTMVTVNLPICNVIRIGITSSQRVIANRPPLFSSAPTPSGNEYLIILYCFCQYLTVLQRLILYIIT